MKNIKNIIIGLVCSVGLFAATITTTVKASEPMTLPVCITISCDKTFCWSGADGANLWKVRDLLTRVLDVWFC